MLYIIYYFSYVLLCVLRILYIICYIVRIIYLPCLRVLAGQVHAAVLPDGTKVAVKVQFPAQGRIVYFRCDGPPASPSWYTLPWPWCGPEHWQRRQQPIQACRTGPRTGRSLSPGVCAELASSQARPCKSQAIPGGAWFPFCQKIKHIMPLYDTRT